jgi:Arc/MetJ-type ribon-helix-helix transcriptional regulator
VREPRLCITFWYANRMAQLVARLDDGLMAEVDRLVADGVVANRSEAVRLGLRRLVDQQQRQRVGAAIVEAYRRQPQADEELAELDEATRALVNEEPW